MKKRTYKSESERARGLIAMYDRDFEKLQLRDSVEDERFGRYYLSGPLIWAEVVTIRGGVIVCGDVDTVCFQWLTSKTPRAPLYWIACAGYDYATAKAARGTGNSAREFDVEVARHCVLYHRRNGTLTRDEAQQLWDFLKSDDANAVTFQAEVYEVTADSELCSMGEVSSSRVLVAQAVLRRLVAELEARDFRTKARGWFQIPDHHFAEAQPTEAA